MCLVRFDSQGYLANADKASVQAWLKEENNTFGAWLSAAGYHTAFLVRSPALLGSA